MLEIASPTQAGRERLVVERCPASLGALVFGSGLVIGVVTGRAP